MGTRNLDDLLSKFGIVGCSLSDKQSFCHLFNSVFDPPLPLSGPKRRGPSSSSHQLEHQQQPSTGTAINPAIAAFRAVFKTHFRRHPYIDWDTAAKEAEAHFRMASKVSNSYESPNNLKVQMETEQRWLKKVNEWRRGNFQASVREESARKFRLQLWDKYPFFNSVITYEEADVQKFSGRLMTKMIADFKGEVPAFETITVRVQWNIKLREELSRVEAEALARNKRNQEWAQKSGLALNQFKDLVSGFFEGNQFADGVKAANFRFEAAGKCVEQHGLAGFLQDSIMKGDWYDKIWREFRALETRWKADGDARIGEFEAAVKAKVERMIRKEFNLTGVKVGNLLVDNFTGVLRRNLDEGVEMEDRGGSETNSEASASGQESDDDNSRGGIKSEGDESSDEEGHHNDDDDDDTSNNSGGREESTGEANADKSGRGREATPAKNNDGGDKGHHDGSSKRSADETEEGGSSAGSSKKTKLEVSSASVELKDDAINEPSK